ncbi:MAG: hypothetical protein OXB96_00070 [Candidatus Kaiserbacteria bacterium]|nr:hypothetical protein [Candidatus Kaiserbacteria bacterium]
MRFLAVLILTVLFGGCGLVGKKVTTPPVDPIEFSRPDPLFYLEVVGQDNLSADLLLRANFIPSEDMQVYLHIFTEDTDGEVLRFMVPQGVTKRKISLMRELFLAAPVFLQVYPCEDGCYSPVEGNVISLF